MKNQLSKNKNPNTGLPKPANSVQTNLQISNIRACFKENNCKDPLAPEASSRARGLCFPQALKGLRDELQACGKKNLSNFQLPEDEFSVASGNNNDVLFLLASTSMQNVGKYCSNVNAQTISSCVAKKWSASGIATQATTDVKFCDTVDQCKSVSFISTNCFTSWNDLMCPCTQSMRFLGTVTKYENQYIDCMKQVGVTVDKSSDPALAWFDASMKGWCDSSSSNRGSSWAPGNRFCEAATTAKVTTQATTKKVTTAKVTTQATTTPYQQEEETTERTWFFDQSTIPTDQETVTESPWNDQPTNPSNEEETTERTWFFDQWTLPPDELTEAPTPSTPAPTTKKSNWPSFLENVGIQNPMDGVWGEILNINNWIKPNGGKK